LKTVKIYNADYLWGVNNSSNDVQSLQPSQFDIRKQTNEHTKAQKSDITNGVSSN